MFEASLSSLVKQIFIASTCPDLDAESFVVGRDGRRPFWCSLPVAIAHVGGEFTISMFQTPQQSY